MDTKEKILNVALALFARDGYEAVSVSMIAGELGITKGALYKHYENKRAIFDSIVQRMEENDYENARSFHMPEDLFEKMPDRYRSTEFEQLCAYTLAQFVYWTEDSFASKFRKMLSLERYRNAEMNALYQQYLGAGPLHYVEDLMGQMVETGLANESARYLALDFYAPVYTLISIYDGGGEPAELAASLKEHMEVFVRRLEKRACELTESEENKMEYPRSKKYSSSKFMSMIMGPNPVKLTEELMTGHLIKPGARVCDLGSGNGLTSLFLAKEYGFQVYASDLWSDPAENNAFFAAQGLGPEQIQAVKADALALPFQEEFFDAVVSVDSYNYFGRDKNYLNEKLLPYVKHGGYIYIAVPGMVKDCHDRLPRELLLSWNPDQLEYMHDIHYWRGIISAAKGVDILCIQQMESNEEVWQDWLEQDNPYAVGDRKSMEAGAGKYLNFIKIILRKR